jgi:hypothetical protein
VGVGGGRGVLVRRERACCAAAGVRWRAGLSRLQELHEADGFFEEILLDVSELLDEGGSLLRR